MILSDIRYLVGVHLGNKGLPPTIIAPTINILSLLDEELSLSGFQLPASIEKEVERLKQAIILLNYDPSDEDDIEEDLAIEEMLKEDEDVDVEEDEDDLLLQDEDEDDD